MARITNICTVLGAVYAPLVTSLATYSPGPSFSVGIPSSSGISSTSTGSLYIQLSAPTSYQWVGFGTGDGMAGSTMFLMYADGNGNVTASVRDGGRGHVQPTLDSTLQSGLTLLAGSGIVGGNMVANLLCTKCKISASSSTSTTSNWIAAWAQGSAISSTSTSYSINQHSDSNTRVFTLDLTAAAISSDSNPFISSSSSSSTSTSSGSTASSTSSSNGNGVTVIGNSASTIAKYDKAHGIIMGVVVTLLFPIGAICIRMGSNLNVHRGIQMLSLISLIVGFVLGIRLAKMRKYLFKGTGATHTIFGTIIVALFLLQPVFGALHHANYVKYQSRTTVSHVHIWYGRIIMILAVINGGLGLQLVANSKSGEIAYGVVAGVMGLGYAGVVALKRKSGGNKNERVDKVLRGGRRSPDEMGSEELQPVVFKH